MRKLLAVTALVALFASPALARSPAVSVYIGPHFVGPLGPNTDWSNIYTDNYGGSRLVRFPNGTHQKTYGLW